MLLEQSHREPPCCEIDKEEVRAAAPSVAPLQQPQASMKP